MVLALLKYRMSFSISWGSGWCPRGPSSTNDFLTIVNLWALVDNVPWCWKVWQSHYKKSKHQVIAYSCRDNAQQVDSGYRGEIFALRRWNVEQKIRRPPSVWRQRRLKCSAFLRGIRSLSFWLQEFIVLVMERSPQGTRKKLRFNSKTLWSRRNGAISVK